MRRFNWASLFSILFGAIIQIWPAIYNRYPLIATDTFYYIECGMMGYVPKHRPIHYGVFIKLFSFFHSLWPVIIIQALIMSYLIFKFLPVKIQEKWYCLASVYVLLGFTGAPWYISQVMPEIFGAFMFLSLLIIIQEKYKSLFELIFLYTICVYSITTHKINLLVLPITFLIVGLINLVIIKEKLYQRRRFLPFIIILSGWFFYAFINYSQDKKFDWRPHSSYAFFLARLSENGLLQKYLEENCDTREYRLCHYIDSIPRNTQYFLFNRDSPFLKTDGWNNTDENKEIVKEIYLSPHFFSKNVEEAFKNSVKQLKVFSIGHLIRKYRTDGSWGMPILHRFFPVEYDQFLKSRQMVSVFNFKLFTRINNYIISFFFALMVLVLILSMIHNNLRNNSWLLFALLFILFNASIPAILVGITPRYHGRVVWILILISIELLNNYIVQRKSGILPPQRQDA